MPLRLRLRWLLSKCSVWMHLQTDLRGRLSMLYLGSDLYRPLQFELSPPQKLLLQHSPDEKIVFLVVYCPVNDLSHNNRPIHESRYTARCFYHKLHGKTCDLQRGKPRRIRSQAARVEIKQRSLLWVRNLSWLHVGCVRCVQPDEIRELHRLEILKLRSEGEVQQRRQRTLSVQQASDC